MTQCLTNNIFLLGSPCRDMYKMSLRRESIYSGKRTESDIMADASSAHMEPQREGPTSAIR